jgi:hypothetical protein
MPFKHKNTPGSNGSVRGRGIGRRRLSEAQRADLADRACDGRLKLHHLSEQQACEIFGISIATMERYRRKEAA